MLPHRPGTPAPFNNACLILLGLFPLFVMFIITAITMQRERASGTLERILTTPLRRLDLLIAYGTAFSIAAAVQATLACIVAFWLLGFDTAGSPLWVFVIAIVNAVLGVGLGLLCSAFARTEFQAVQFIPLVMVPQLLLAGIIVPRALMPNWLEWISNVLPASYALEALQQVGAHTELTGVAVRDIAGCVGFCARGIVPGRRDPSPTDTLSWRPPSRAQTARDVPAAHPTPASASWSVPENCLPAMGLAILRYGRWQRRRESIRAGAPLLRHQGKAVRRGGSHPDRPDGYHRPVARGSRRGTRLQNTVDVVAAVGFRAGCRVHRHAAVDPCRARRSTCSVRSSKT